MLIQSLEQSYQQHPSFANKASSMQVDPLLLERFDDSYNLVVACKGKLPEKDFASCLADCVKVLDEIFRQLSLQAKDSHEKDFLASLRDESEVLLVQELRHYNLPSNIKSIHFKDQKQKENTSHLLKHRHFFSKISKSAVGQILSLGQHELNRFRENAAAGRLTREDLSINGGRIIRDIVDILDPEFEKNGALNAMSIYSGRKINVTGLSLELSVPQANWWKNKLDQVSQPPQTLYAHFDEGIWVPKSIVYLTDVKKETGATSCYPGVYESLALNRLQDIIGRRLPYVATGSPDQYKTAYHQPFASEEFRRHFMRLPASLRFNSHFGWDVLPGSAIEQKLVDSERTMVGEAGTCIVFDGSRLLHRGGLVYSGERIAMQVILGEKKKLLGRVREKLGKVKRKAGM